MLEQLDFLIRRYDLDLRLNQGHLKSDSCLSQINGFFVLSVRRGLEGPELVEAIAVQIARLVLGHEGRRWRWLDARQDRREWTQALRWAAKTLIPDELMVQAEREEWELWQLAEEAGVTERLAGIRMDGWLVNHLVPDRLVAESMDRPPFFTRRGPEFLTEETGR
ncbi:hypothetical protein D3C87_1411720 [compost metagenome]